MVSTNCVPEVTVIDVGYPESFVWRLVKNQVEERLKNMQHKYHSKQ
jgi:hypothetical protein